MSHPKLFGLDPGERFVADEQQFDKVEMIQNAILKHFQHWPEQQILLPPQLY
jgi:hypothetical protein